MRPLVEQHSCFSVSIFRFVSVACADELGLRRNAAVVEQCCHEQGPAGIGQHCFASLHLQLELLSHFTPYSSTRRATQRTHQPTWPLSWSLAVAKVTVPLCPQVRGIFDDMFKQQP